MNKFPTILLALLALLATPAVALRNPLFPGFRQPGFAAPSFAAPTFARQPAPVRRRQPVALPARSEKISETDSEWTIAVSAPGSSPELWQASRKGGVLTIAETAPAGAAQSTAYNKRFQIPEGCDEEHIRMEREAGGVVLRLPKAAAAQQAAAAPVSPAASKWPQEDILVVEDDSWDEEEPEADEGAAAGYWARGVFVLY